MNKLDHHSELGKDPELKNIGLYGQERTDSISKKNSVSFIHFFQGPGVELNQAFSADPMESLDG